MKDQGSPLLSLLLFSFEVAFYMLSASYKLHRENIICLEDISGKPTCSFDASGSGPQIGFEKRIQSRHLSAHSTSLDALPF